MAGKLRGTTTAERVRERRAQLGLTQTEASVKAGWKRHSTWADIEGGRKSLTLKTMEKVAAALKCRINDLIP